ncbi:hypothetical protein BHE74_00019829 [Ensete ventricosum]|nr:hypothetical protein BHE74_00019829 [Ensete ventricosum]
MVNLNLVRDMSKVGGGRRSPAAPNPAQLTSIPSSSPEVQEIQYEEATRKAVEASGKRKTEETSGPRKKTKVTGRHKSCREGEGSKSRATKGKGPTSLVDEVLVPRTRPKSMRELCSARLRANAKDYHVVRMSSLPEQLPTSPSDAFVSLTHDTHIWQDGTTSAKYAQEVQIPHLATNAGAGLDVVVVAEQWAFEAQSLVDHYKVELKEATRQRESLEMELSEVKDLLDDSHNQLNNA